MKTLPNVYGNRVKVQKHKFSKGKKLIYPVRLKIQARFQYISTVVWEWRELLRIVCIGNHWIMLLVLLLGFRILREFCVLLIVKKKKIWGRKLLWIYRRVIKLFCNQLLKLVYNLNGQFLLLNLYSKLLLHNKKTKKAKNFIKLLHHLKPALLHLRRVQQNLKLNRSENKLIILLQRKRKDLNHLTQNLQL